MSKLNLLLSVIIVVLLLTTSKGSANYYTTNITKCDTVYKADTIRDTIKEIIFLPSILKVKSNEDPNKLEFINKAVTIAVLAEKNGGAPAEIVVAGAIFESGYGTSNLAKLANNYCGHMFSKSQLSKPGVVGNYGKWTKFKNMESSLINHSMLLKNTYNINSLKDIDKLCPYIDSYSCRKGLYITKLLSTIDMWDLKNKCNNARKMLF
jgi:hypothetical protein